MRKWIIALAVLAAPMLGTPAVAQSVEAGTLVIENPYAFATAPSAKSAAGYLTITNKGDAPDRLIEARGDFAAVAVHTSEMKNDVVTMMPVASLQIDPGQTVTMEPGRMHVMFMGLEEPFEEGDTVTATLVFESAGEVEVSFPVQARDKSGHGGHGSHGSVGN